MKKAYEQPELIEYGNLVEITGIIGGISCVD